MSNITHESVQELFNHIKVGQSDKFFAHIADDVHWTVLGTHPLAGDYHSKEEFMNHTFKRLNKVLKQGLDFSVTNVIIENNIAVVEMKAKALALNGKPFNNVYCWVVKFSEGLIVEVRAYIDSALVKQTIEENETGVLA
jgi:uncharacterized protein